MAAFLYRCPNTHRNVQGWLAEEETSDAADVYRPVKCLACGVQHLVDPRTGQVAGQRDK